MSSTGSSSPCRLLAANQSGEDNANVACMTIRQGPCQTLWSCSFFIQQLCRDVDLTGVTPAVFISVVRSHNASHFWTLPEGDSLSPNKHKPDAAVNMQVKVNSLRLKALHVVSGRRLSSYTIAPSCVCGGHHLRCRLSSVAIRRPGNYEGL